MKTNPKVLFIQPGPEGPHIEKGKNIFACLSRYLRGDVLSTTWWDEKEERNQKITEISEACGHFTYQATNLFLNRFTKLKPIAHVAYYLSKAFWLQSTKGKYDVTVAYGTLTTGLASILFKYLTNTKCIVEVPGNPWTAREIHNDAEKITLKDKIAPAITSFVLKHADHVKLLYPSQIGPKVPLSPDMTSVFHDFVPIQTMQPGKKKLPLIMLIGYPWKLKGADTLIQAFQKISADYPNHHLKIVGFCPDKTPFIKLAAGNDRIELLGPMPNSEVVDLLSQAELFVLPSRTEAMGRVLLEAMKVKTPIIASNVDGIPHYVVNGETGLLVPPNNVDELANAMREMMDNPQKRLQYADKAFQRVTQKYTEDKFALQFRQMVDFVINPKECAPN